MTTRDHHSSNGEWLSLSATALRARDVHGKLEAGEKLRQAISRNRIRTRARVLRTYASEEAYEISNNGIAPRFRDPDFAERESAAHRWATGADPLPKDGSVQLERAENVTFVYTCISLLEEHRDAVIPFRDLPKGSQLSLDSPGEQLTLHTCTFDPHQRNYIARYRTDSVYTRYDAVGVECLRSHVDIVFPYAVGFPTRGRRGRPVKFKVEDSLVILRGLYPAGAEPAVMADAERALAEMLPVDQGGISAGTLRSHVRNFYDERGLKK